MGHFILPAIALVGISIHIYLSREQASSRRMLEIALLWLIPLFIGVTSLYAFLGHAFAADKVALYIGWPPGNPFQLEVGVANLAIGILGLSCIWLRGNFWVATIMADAIFGYGAAVVHIMEISVHHNWAPGNAGPALYLDVIAPTIFIALLSVMKVLERTEVR
jgi:hypothetical protein